MIACVYGTTGELIKLAPVLVRLEKRGAAITTWCTGQQSPELLGMVDALGLPHPDYWLAEGLRGRPLSHPRHAPTWAAILGGRFAFHYRELRRMLRADEPSIVIVHGDTFTTVAGSLIGRALGAPVAHIEAGMRSHDWRNPFPEEINRRVAAKLVDVHFAPGDQAVANLAGESGEVVNTFVNTVCDSLDLAPDVFDPRLPNLPEGYGVVSIHRFELLRDSARFGQTLNTLARWSRQRPMVFIDHPPTAARITQLGLDDLFNDTTFVRVPKLDYFAFVTLVRHSAFAVTDSGGLQQESAHLNHPCLVHRATTESPEGLGRSVVVSGLDLAVLEDFLADPTRFHGDEAAHAASPSDIVVDWLEDHGYCRPVRPATPPLPAHVDLGEDGLLSVLVPAYQPENAIGQAVRQLIDALAALDVPFEIIVASAGSTQATLDDAEAADPARVHPVEVAGQPGKGAALRGGFGLARGTHVAFIDPGMELHPDGIGRLLEILQSQGLDIVVGTKSHPDSRVYYPPFRRFQSGTFRRLTRALFHLDVSDPQTGLKVFRREVLDDVLPNVSADGFAFDLEVLVRAADLGYRIGEGPIQLDYRFTRTTGVRAVGDVLVDTAKLAVWRVLAKRRGRWASRRRRPDAATPRSPSQTRSQSQSRPR